MGGRCLMRKGHFLATEDNPLAAREKMAGGQKLYDDYLIEREKKYEKMRADFIESASPHFPNSLISELTIQEVSVFRFIAGIENGDPVDPDALSAKWPLLTKEIMDGTSSALAKLGVTLDEARARTAHLRPEMIK